MTTQTPPKKKQSRLANAGALLAICGAIVCTHGCLFGCLPPHVMFGILPFLAGLLMYALARVRREV